MKGADLLRLVSIAASEKVKPIMNNMATCSSELFSTATSLFKSLTYTREERVKNSACLSPSPSPQREGEGKSTDYRLKCWRRVRERPKAELKIER